MCALLRELVHRSMGHCKSFAMGLCDPDIGTHFTGVLDAPTPNYVTDSLVWHPFAKRYEIRQGNSPLDSWA